MSGCGVPTCRCLISWWQDDKMFTWHQACGGSSQIFFFHTLSVTGKQEMYANPSSRCAALSLTQSKPITAPAEGDNWDVLIRN